jgi:TrmH family RNA methyltransferase
METITSPHNEKIKALIHLQKARARREQGLIVVEGRREIELAIKSGQKLEQLFYCSDFFGDDESFKFIGATSGEIIATYQGQPVDPSVFTKIAYKENPDGWLATFIVPDMSLSDIRLGACPLVLVLEAVEKPGNLGAILRTAYAAGVEAVIVADPLTDIYNPNVIRASQGHVFTVPLAAAGKEDVLAWLKEKNLKILSAALPAEKLYTDMNWRQPAAIIFGTEADGLSDFWLDSSDTLIKIPMRAGIDSLNLSVSAGIVLYEAQRQRGFKV